MVFCNMDTMTIKTNFAIVTILILIDGFLQYKIESNFNELIEMSQSLF